MLACVVHINSFDVARSFAVLYEQQTATLAKSYRKICKDYSKTLPSKYRSATTMSGTNVTRPKHTQTVIDATQKKTAVDQQQQHCCETLICQRHQTILRLLSNAATASTRWRDRELYCQSTYAIVKSVYYST